LVDESSHIKELSHEIEPADSKLKFTYRARRIKALTLFFAMISRTSMLAYPRFKFNAALVP
jgi:hypothetical protein